MLKSILLVVLTLALCQSAPHHEHEVHTFAPLAAYAQMDGLIRNKTSGRESVVSGIIQFNQDQKDGLVRISVNISFTPQFDEQDKVLRGIHIHALPITNNTGNPTIDCGTAGPHWNPKNVTHGLLGSEVRHFGDLGNVVTHNGHIMVELDQIHLSLVGNNTLVGHSVVLHERADDGGLGTDPTSKTAGNSGARIACGTIKLRV